MQYFFSLSCTHAKSHTSSEWNNKNVEFIEFCAIGVANEVRIPLLSLLAFTLQYSFGFIKLSINKSVSLKNIKIINRIIIVCKGSLLRKTLEYPEIKLIYTLHIKFIRPQMFFEFF